MEIQLSWIEWVGFLTALVYLIFSINQSIWLWPLGILSAVFYMIVFYKTNLYADMILQVYYLLVGVYGWLYWKGKQRDENKEKININVVNRKQAIVGFACFSLLYALLVVVLKYLPELFNIPSSDMIYLDAFTTAGSFIATYMLVKKMIEQWVLWIIIDTVAIGMYMYKELYFTSILFFIYTVMAVWGYFSWRKELKLQLICKKIPA